MTTCLHIALAQLNPAAGDLAANSRAILTARTTSKSADLIVTPAGVLTGSPLADLGRKPAFLAAEQTTLAELATATTDGGPALLIGTTTGHALLADGQIMARTDGPAGRLTFSGCRLGVLSDSWPSETAQEDRIAILQAEGIDLLIHASARPFARGAPQAQLDHHQAVARRHQLPVLHVGRTGGQDDLVFSGGSLALDAAGRLLARLPDWTEDSTLVSWQATAGLTATDSAPHLPEEEQLAIYHACVIALRDYVTRNSFPGILLGLSGGLDSALSAAIAVDALGAERVWCVMLASQFTSTESLEDASGCAELLGCRLDNIMIEPAVAAMEAMVAPLFAGQPRNLAEENIQARLRMAALMGLSNKFGHMLLSTSNKSEIAIGYSTIYGDMAGGYNVLKDLYKSEAFALSRWRNIHHPRLGLGPAGPVMPERVITKPPSAELRADQRDDDNLPPYDVLDPILRALIDEDLAVDAIAQRGFERDDVARIERLLLTAEYKRWQSCPGVRLTAHSFARDREYPATNAFRTV